MSTDHTRRLYRAADDALRKAAMGEPYGLAVEFTFAPVMGPGGQPTGLGPAWFVIVTIRSPIVGEPDLGHGIPVHGVLPAEQTMAEVAVDLLKLCRQDAIGKSAIPTMPDLALTDMKPSSSRKANVKG